MNRIHRFALAGAAVAFAATGCAHNERRAAQADAERANQTGVVRIDQTIQKLCQAAPDRAPMFDFNSASLTTEARQSLDMVAYCLSDGPMKGKTLHIVGYTDPAGTESYNYELGYVRAGNVAKYLTNHGVKRSQLVVMTLGEEGASPDPERWPAERIVDLTMLD
ncbi:MAG: hypothetical protein DI536_12665 [Archangium gephyra]|uniref:OmpA-like domain-containing protein n=1 Tax=Archangium gephyra TaxID=48 RepID=A0A2W5TQD7_9BACT|nr:MAG: hypothetical protein DI536_12665 [Archangium gephyra]